ncbi:MAG: ubiquinone/menaquinone biosynthesis methyltransferase [Thermodesulfovibrionales bacterium]|nr:ubiquinone/menaquinone biosynthesis methyltransferase [Thermodesulfovibrionales bacterium]
MQQQPTVSRLPNFDDIHSRYDILNRILSLGFDKTWRQEMSNIVIQKGCKTILDLASGTGDSAKDLIKNGCKVVALDLSQKMLYNAVTKINSHQFMPVIGSGYEIPFKDCTFDAVTCAFGIRNMHYTTKAIAEIFRVLKHGGWIFILEFSMPQRKTFREAYKIYLKYWVPLIAGILSNRPAYEYLGDSIEAFHSREEFCKIITENGFHNCQVKDLTLGTVTLYLAVK